MQLPAGPDERSRPAAEPHRPRHQARGAAGAGRRSSPRSRPARSSSTATPLGELLARWLDHVSEQLSPTTVREYRRLVRTMIDPDLGKLPLRRVTTQRLDAYYASLARERGLSPASIRHVHAVLRGALGQAVRWGWISVQRGGQRLAAQTPPHGRSRRRRCTTRGRLLEAADEHDPDFGALVRVLVGDRRAPRRGVRFAVVGRRRRRRAQ